MGYWLMVAYPVGVAAIVHSATRARSEWVAADRDRGWWLGLLVTGTFLAAGPLVALAYGLGVVPRFRQGVNDAFRR